MEQIKKISIPARVAYGINCLEKVLLHYNVTVEKWKWILEKLWSYTSIEFVDDWFYEFADYLPDTFPVAYDKDEFEYLSEKDFYNLKETYQDGNQIIFYIIRVIFELGTVEIYGRIEKGSPKTLNLINKIENVLKDNDINLPDITPFLEYSIEVNNGWGERFDGKSYSLIL